MGRIFCLMGKSSSGKDTLYARLSEKLHFSTIVPYTTRPIREGEEEGREYHFITEKEVEEFEKQGRIIELRAYNTVHGVWKYLTVDDKPVSYTHLKKERWTMLLLFRRMRYTKMRETPPIFQEI